MDKKTLLGQYPTPAWAAEAIVRTHLPALDERDYVVEPSCGPGRFLQAIPEHVPLTGVEIDPELAQMARDITGRHVVTGDFLELKLEDSPTVIVGNPPFATKTIEAFLDKAHRIMDREGRVLFILPAYFFQTARRVARYSEQWSIMQEMLPRNLYKGLKYPLTLATFMKDQKRSLIGFGLFHELAHLQGLPKAVQEAMNEGPMTWGGLVKEAIAVLGGEAALKDIYDYVADRRPTPNEHWREQVRKQCQKVATRVGRGRYTVSEHQCSLAL